MPFARAAPPELGLVDVNILALNTTLYYAADLSYAALDIGLSSALFGVLTLLVIVAVTFLIRRGLSHTSVRVLLPSTLLLYGSTTLYMASLAGHITCVNHLVSQARAGLFSDTYTNVAVEAFEGDVLKQSWMMTIALAINIHRALSSRRLRIYGFELTRRMDVAQVLVGDSIVWWRACAVWRTRPVYCLGPLLIALSFAFGVKALSGVHQCTSPCRQPQMLLPDGFLVDACAVLSLAVNMIATALIGVKAWEYRQLLKGHFGCVRGKSRVMKALALLVESGTIYCILLILVLVYEASPALFAAPDVHQNPFLRALADYTYACFIPIIAVYPVLIIVIVALNWSPIEHALTNTTAGSVAGEDACSPTTLDFNRTTMSTVPIAHIVEAHHDHEDALDC